MTEVLKSVDLCFMDILIFEKFRSSFFSRFWFLFNLGRLFLQVLVSFPFRSSFSPGFGFFSI